MCQARVAIWVFLKKPLSKITVVPRRCTDKTVTCVSRQGSKQLYGMTKPNRSLHNVSHTLASVVRGGREGLHRLLTAHALTSEQVRHKLLRLSQAQRKGKTGKLRVGDVRYLNERKTILLRYCIRCDRGKVSKHLDGVRLSAHTQKEVPMPHCALVLVGRAPGR